MNIQEIMDNSNQPSQTNATWNQGMGEAKKTAGDWIGSERMQGEGQSQHASGKMEEMGAKATQMFDEAKNKVSGVFSGLGKSSGQNNQ